jgi:DNA invertase Pin-like site-specific DNA recombinase
MKNSEHSYTQSKITPRHLQRLAFIYVRQSSPGQVKHNLESQAYQYRLAERAEALGWHKEQIRIIDSDQGTSARSSGHRDGYKEMISEISLSRVGIVFGYEVARMSRNNSDWYALLDVAALFGTLIADAEGIYDPRLYNDRMLLGLKGAISEAESHLIMSRLRQGRLEQVERGEFKQRLPTGLTRTPDGAVVKDPDEQVCHTIDLIFTKFKELGSCGRVLQYCLREGILLPRRQLHGPQNNKLVWKPATRSAIYDLISNPAYAGAFVYGRRQVDPASQLLGQPSSGRLRRGMGEWTHAVHGVYPAFITWEQFEANLARLRQLSGQHFAAKADGASGVEREGKALLQGIAVCGRCGRRLQVNYNNDGWYFCGAHSETGAAGCPAVPCGYTDYAVEVAFFEALKPSQLDALKALLAEQKVEHAKLDRHWQERLGRLRYETEAADQRFHAVDPRNRLVAAELERRWEEKLHEVARAEQEFEKFLRRPASLRPELCDAFRRISETLPALWEGDKISPRQKKAILRSLVSNVILRRAVQEAVDVKIVWVSGHFSEKTVPVPVRRQRDLSNYGLMAERVHRLWQQGLTDAKIARTLAAEGFRSAQTSSVTPDTVIKIRRAHGWRSRR